MGGRTKTQPCLDDDLPCSTGGYATCGNFYLGALRKQRIERPNQCGRVGLFIPLTP